MPDSTNDLMQLFTAEDQRDSWKEIQRLERVIEIIISMAPQEDQPTVRRELSDRVQRVVLEAGNPRARLGAIEFITKELEQRKQKAEAEREKQLRMS